MSMDGTSAERCNRCFHKVSECTCSCGDCGQWLHDCSCPDPSPINAARTELGMVPDGLDVSWEYGVTPRHTLRRRYVVRGEWAVM